MAGTPFAFPRRGLRCPRSSRPPATTGKPPERPFAHASPCCGSWLDLFNLRARDGAVGAALEIRVKIVDVVHHDLAARERDHALLEPAIAHGLDEVFLAEGLQAF